MDEHFNKEIESIRSLFHAGQKRIDASRREIELVIDEYRGKEAAMGRYDMLHKSVQQQIIMLQNTLQTLTVKQQESDTAQSKKNTDFQKLIIDVGTRLSAYEASQNKRMGQFNENVQDIISAQKFSDEMIR